MTDQQTMDARVATLRLDGLTPMDIAIQLGVHRRTVYRALVRLEMTTGGERPHVSPEIHELAVAIDGYYVKHLAKHPELCRGEVWPALRGVEALIVEHAERANG